MVTEILRKAEESAGRSFELQKEHIDRDIKLTYTPDREAFISDQVGHCRAIIKGLAGFESLMKDLPPHVRPYDPTREASRRFAIMDLMDGMASEKDLFRVFAMKYFEYLKIDYLQTWRDRFEPSAGSEFHKLFLDSATASRMVPRLIDLYRDRGPWDIVRLLQALHYRELIVDFMKARGLGNKLRQSFPKCDTSNITTARNSLIEPLIENHPNYSEFLQTIDSILSNP